MYVRATYTDERKIDFTELCAPHSVVRECPPRFTMYVLCPSVRSDHGMIQPCSNAAEHGRIRVGPESEQGREKGPYVGQLICSDPDPTLFRPCSNLTGSDQVGVHIRSDQGRIRVGTGQSGTLLLFTLVPPLARVSELSPGRTGQCRQSTWVCKPAKRAETFLSSRRCSRTGPARSRGRPC